MSASSSVPHVSSPAASSSSNAGADDHAPTLTSGTVLQRANSEPLTFLSAAMWLGIALTAFFGPLDLALEAAPMQVGLDSRVAFKLGTSAFCALLGFYGLCFSEHTRRTIVCLPSILIALLLVLTIPSALSGLSSSALPAAMINLCYLVFVPTCLSRLGLRRFMMAVLAGLTGLMVMAWFLYFVMPQYGAFPELLDDGLIVIRLGGVAHPNSVGRLAAMGFLIVLYLWTQNGLPTTLSVILSALMLSALIHAQSRTATVAVGAGLLVLFADRLISFAGVMVATILSLSLMLGLLAFALSGGDESRITDKLVGLVAKSGKAEELTSGTGRVEIWQKSVSLIAEKPLTGHGFGAAAILMTDFSQSTHNVLLHSMMLAGVGGGLIMLVLQGWLLSMAFMADNKFIRSMAAFLLICGLMEETLLETFPGAATMFWIACSVYLAMKYLVPTPNDITPNPIAATRSADGSVAVMSNV
ncbi:O-antigen ligase family protein [Stieleria varia]|uniref:O-Antigen ligase n=1 Tax=Stieleria varia TaxID=2528005 RepID=A0A5C6AG73_9BACT|nr:O-antigen ligase family protein [Stieleria varia]TWT98406.1 O-Antigen ligase [Stieleria varia]